MDDSKHARLDSDEFLPAILEGATIYDADNHKIGSVDRVHGLGEAADIVIDVGGFLGIGAKPVLVPIGDLNFMRDGDGKVFCVTTWTKEQLKDMPKHQD
jgi:ribosomal 30S subunit maturation factor RimM